MNAFVPGLAITCATFSVMSMVTGPPTIVRLPTALPSSDVDSNNVRHPAQRTTLWRSNVAQIAGGLALVWLAGPLAALIAIITIVGARRARGITRQRQAQRDIDRDLPEALDLFVLLLEAGVNARDVVILMAQRGPVSTRPGFAHVADRLDIGQPFGEAVAQLRTLGPGAVALVDVLISSQRYGLPMTHVVSQLSTEARATRRRRDEAQARALPVKLSFPLVVCTLPSFVLLAIAPAVMAALSSLSSNGW